MEHGKMLRRGLDTQKLKNLKNVWLSEKTKELKRYLASYILLFILDKIQRNQMFKWWNHKNTRRKYELEENKNIK